MQVFLNKLNNDKNTWLVSIFIAYIGLILLFSIIYTLVFSSAPSRFSFNNEITETQYKLELASTKNDIIIIAHNINLLEKYSTFLHKDSSKYKVKETLNGTKSEVKVGDYLYEFYTEAVHSLGVFLRFRIKYENGEELLDVGEDQMQNNRTFYNASLQFPLKASEAIKLTKKLINYYQLEQKNLDKQINTISQNPITSYGYWDFLYFSVVTQSTLGYGDIIPNSRLVRILVILQTIIGLILVVVAINVVITDQKK